MKTDLQHRMLIVRPSEQDIREQETGIERSGVQYEGNQNEYKHRTDIDNDWIGNGRSGIFGSRDLYRGVICRIDSYDLRRRTVQCAVDVSVEYTERILGEVIGK